MGDRQRTETGEYVETVTSEKVLDALKSISDPVATATEVGEEIGCTGQAARKKLNQLHETGEVERKTVGARAVVWWRPENDTDVEDTAHEQAFEEFSARLTEACGEKIHEIILYGSVARGDHRETGSDVDVLIIIESEAARDTVHDHASSIGFDVMIEYDVLVSKNIKTKEEFEQQKDSPYLTNVRREGRAYAG
jgi:predicted nucleotidyltransferase